MANKQNKSTTFGNCKVFQFPSKSQPQKQTLTDTEINSLFLGLVKLVKENSSNVQNPQLDIFLQQTQLQKRKELLAKKQNQKEVDLLKKQIEFLKQQNSILQQKLMEYRVNYVCSLKDNNKK